VSITKGKKIFALSILLTNADYIAVSDDEITEGIHIRHAPSVVTADSIEDAKRQGYELVSPRYPANEGWEIDVIAIELFT
jgi:hypothetical protein